MGFPSFDIGSSLYPIIVFSCEFFTLLRRLAFRSNGVWERGVCPRLMMRACSEESLVASRAGRHQSDDSRAGSTPVQSWFFSTTVSLDGLHLYTAEGAHAHRQVAQCVSLMLALFSVSSDSEQTLLPASCQQPVSLAIESTEIWQDECSLLLHIAMEAEHPLSSLRQACSHHVRNEPWPWRPCRWSRHSPWCAHSNVWNQLLFPVVQDRCAHRNVMHRPCTEKKSMAHFRLSSARVDPCLTRGVSLRYANARKHRYQYERREGHSSCDLAPLTASFGTVGQWKRQHRATVPSTRSSTHGPDAKTAVDKEWEKLEKLPAWQLTKVRSKKRGHYQSAKRS